MKSILAILLSLFIWNNTWCQDEDTLNIYFKTDQFQLTPIHKKAIHSFVNKICDINYIWVAGYTDKSGSSEYNLKLSLKRANSVKEYLSQIGMDTLIREFNYFGKSKALGVLPTKKIVSSGKVLSDRRVEIIVSSNPERTLKALAAKEKRDSAEHASREVMNVPGTNEKKDSAENILPVADTSVKDLTETVNVGVVNIKTPVQIINSRLNNDVILTYPKGIFSDYLEAIISQGDGSIAYTIESLEQMRLANMLSMTDSGQILSSLAILCFDTLRFVPPFLDTLILVKLPVHKTTNCLFENIKFYASINDNGKMKWHEQPNKFQPEIINDKPYISFPIDNLNRCVNFAYCIEPPCFNPYNTLLKFKRISPKRIEAVLTNINCIYIPKKKENNTYEIIQDKDENTELLLDMVVQDNRKKIYTLRNFPVLNCTYDAKHNTYTVRKRDIKKYLR